MPDNTANYALVKPTVGANRDTWGSFLNGDLDAVDAIMAALTPIGAVTDFAGWITPSGWLLCDGTVYPIATYPKLASVIGNAYGGDAVTTFAVPDCRGRVTAGVGQTTDSGGFTTGFDLSQRIGWFVQNLNANYLPSVEVTIDAAGNHGHTGWTDSQGAHQHSGATEGAGDHAHTYHRASISTPANQMAPGSGFALNETDPTTSTAGNHAHQFWTSWDGWHTHTIWADYAGAHTHTGRIAGGGQPMAVYQPLIAFNKIIFAGPPGFTTLSSPIPGAPARMASPMRGGG